MNEIKNTKYGTQYYAPVGIEQENYYDLMYELMDFTKEKGLTARQAHELFSDCLDMIFDAAKC